MFKLSSTIIRSFWFAVLLVLFGLGSSITASPLSPALTLFGYDAQSRASAAYDVGFRSIFGYDSAPRPIAGGEVNPTVGASNLFGEFGGRKKGSGSNN
jgi:hypothetical protein